MNMVSDLYMGLSVKVGNFWSLCNHVKTSKNRSGAAKKERMREQDMGEFSCVLLRWERERVNQSVRETDREKESEGRGEREKEGKRKENE